MSPQAIAVREQPQGGALAMWDTEQIDVIKRLICPDATDTELALFGQVCKRTGLDPFARQIYGIKRKGRLTIQTSIDGLRLSAQRSREYAGQDGPQWCGEDGAWRDVWLSKEFPSAARVGVYRIGWPRPAWGIATWSEYAQYFNGKPGEMWASMPSTMLAKCAEAQALRKAFPAELSGLHSTDEMGQADNTETASVSPPTPNPIQGEIVDDVQPWMATYHQQWGKGAAKANQIGAEIPEKLETSEGKAACDARLRQLAANVKRQERAHLEDELRDVIGVAIEAGAEWLQVPENLSDLEESQIRDMIADVQAAIPTTVVA